MNSLQYILKNAINSRYLLHSNTCRYLRHSVIQYEGKNDPAPLFFDKEVQSLLKSLTRVDYNKVFRKRRSGKGSLSNPEYKFMTDTELNVALEESKQKAEELLQIPPVVKIKPPKTRVVSKDPALKGLATSKLVFTDITFGVKDADRIIIVREPDGNLVDADWDIRKRVNQVYFPSPGRLLTPPAMFEDSYLESLLERNEYEFILDRACVQFDPDESEYQRITSLTYQHLNEQNKFELLRSTRHFGSLVFFLVWNKNIDNLLLDLIETLNMHEAENLITLYSKVHNIKFEGSTGLERVEHFINTVSNKKGALELAVQAYQDIIKKREEVEKGVKTAHGITD